LAIRGLSPKASCFPLVKAAWIVLIKAMVEVFLFCICSKPMHSGKALRKKTNLTNKFRQEGDMPTFFHFIWGKKKHLRCIFFGSIAAIF